MVKGGRRVAGRKTVNNGIDEITFYRWLEEENVIQHAAWWWRLCKIEQSICSIMATLCE